MGKFRPYHSPATLPGFCFVRYDTLHWKISLDEETHHTPKFYGKYAKLLTEESRALLAKVARIYGRTVDDLRGPGSLNGLTEARTTFALVARGLEWSGLEIGMMLRKEPRSVAKYLHSRSERAKYMAGGILREIEQGCAIPRVERVTVRECIERGCMDGDGI